MTRFSRVFQLLTVVLVVAIVNVYVMGAPKASTDPKKADAPATNATTTDLASAENVANAKVTTVAVASEKLKLADRYHPTYVDSVWAEVQPRSF